jgi:hypothetical protein
LHDEKLVKAAETYGRITTVFLALQIAGMTFLITQLNGDHAIFYFGIIGIPPMIASLAVFLGISDPRFDLSQNKRIDIGIALFAASLFITAIGSGYGTYVITRDLFLGVAMSAAFIGTMLIFYPFGYYRYLRNKP